MNNLYEQLIAMPLWLHSAFGTFMTSDVLSDDSVQVKLMYYLVLKTINNCPCYEAEYCSNWNIKDYVPLFKAALKTTEKFVM